MSMLLSEIINGLFTEMNKQVEKTDSVSGRLKHIARYSKIIETIDSSGGIMGDAEWQVVYLCPRKGTEHLPKKHWVLEWTKTPLHANKKENTIFGGNSNYIVARGLQRKKHGEWAEFLPFFKGQPTTDRWVESHNTTGGTS